MSKLGKIGITVGNKTGGSPAATVSQLKSYLKDLQNGFDELKRAAEPAANQVSRLSDSMSRINESASNIVKFSEDLSKKLQSIRAQGVGKLNPDATVFSSFSDLVDIVTNSVDETKLAKFQSVSKSLRAFSSSLTDIVQFSKDANGDVFKQFVSNLNSEDTKNTKNKIFEFINNFMPSDSGMLDTLTTNIEKMNNVVSSVKKYISTLSGLRSTGTKDVDVPEEWNIARQRFYDFIRGFKLEGDVPTYIKNITDLTKPIAKYLSEIKSLNRLGEEGKIDTTKWDRTRQAFYDFLTSFGTEGDVPAAIERVGTLTKAVGKYISEIKTLTKLGQEGEIDTAKWDSVRQKFYDFIRGFGLEGDIPTSIERLGTLTKAVGRYLSEIKTLTTTGNIDDSVIEKWNNTRLAFYNFLRGFGIEGDIPESLKHIGILTKALGNYLTLLKGMNKYKANPDNWGDARNSFTSFVTDFNNIASSIKHDKLDELLKVVRKYITIMKTLDSYTPNPSSWNIIRDTFTDFITDFNRTSTDVSYDKTDVLIKSVRKYISIMKTLDSYTPNPSSWNIIRDTFTDFITDFNNVSANISHDKTDELIKYVRKYISIMKTLDSYTPNPSGWNIIRDTFMDFITDFDSLAKNINHAKVDDLVKVVRKYISIMKTLDSYTPNPSAWEIVRDTFTDFITDFDNISSKTSHTNTDELVKSVRKYISIMKTLDSYTPNPSGWNIIRDTFTDFITDFNNISSKISHANTDELVKSVRRYVSIMKTLDGYTPDLSAWYIVRDEFTNFISGFVPSDPTISAQLNTGLSMIEQISSVLKKYISMSKAIISFGTVDWASLGNGFKDFISLVASVVSDPRITGISDKSIQHFSKISNSLKGIATLINSVSGKSFSNLRNNLSNAVAEIEAFIDKMASLTSRASFPDFERVANAVGKFDVKLKDVTSTVEHTTRSMTRFKSILRQIYTAFVGGAVIYSIVRSIKSAVKEVFNLEYAMKRVNTIARVSSNELKNLTHVVQGISATYGISSDKIAKALYDINSATIKGSASLKILEQSAKLAIAGFTDIEKVTSLIARAVNAYEYSVSEASKISDILFVTVERGINPMEELSEYMGRLFTVAANAGVSLEEVGAGLATLTARGYQTNVASTALNSAILKLSTGTDKLNKLFRQYGYASSASALRTVGLTGALQVLYKATNGATEKLHDLGFNYRDIRAATTLASGAIDDYNKTLSLMNDETYKGGLAQKALGEAQETVKFKFSQLTESFKTGIQELAEYVNTSTIAKTALDILITGITSLRAELGGLNVSVKDQLSSSFIKLIPQLIETYAVFKLFGKFFISGTGQLLSFAGAVDKLKLSLTALKASTGVFLVIEGVLNAINILVKDFGDASGYFGDSFHKIWTDISKDWTKFFTYLGDGIASLVGLLGDVITKFVGLDFNLRQKLPLLIHPELEQTGEAGIISENKDYSVQRQFANKVREEISSLRDLSITDLDAINAEYNKGFSEIQKFGKVLGLSDDWIKENIKAYIKVNESKLQENKELWNLMPKVKTLSDVFEDAAKTIGENAKKSNNSWGDSIKNVVKAQLGMETVMKETGASMEEVRSAFATASNVQDFYESVKIDPELLEKQIKDAFSIIDEINVRKESAFSDAVSLLKKYGEYETPMRYEISNDFAYKQFADLFNKADYEGAVSFLGSLNSEVRGVIGNVIKNELSNIKGLDIGEYLLKEPLKPFEISSFGGLYGSNIEYGSDKALSIVISNIKKVASSLPKYAQKMLPDVFEKAKKDLSGVTDVKKIGAYFANALTLGEDFVKATTNLEVVMPEAIDDILKFGEVVSQLGIDLNKLDIKGIDAQEILDNVFGLTEVDLAKEALKNKIVKFKDLVSFDSETLDSVLFMALQDMVEGVHPDKIKRNLIEYAKQGLGLVEDEDVSNAVNEMFGALTRIATATTKFMTQLPELDFAKTMNKLKFGSELSVFKQFNQVGKGMLESIYKQTIGGFSFDSLLSEFETNKKQYGFDEAQKMLMDKFGDEGAQMWNKFASLFKELGDLVNTFIAPINTEFRNLKKRGLDFVKNYRDSMLSPIEQFNKTQDLLNRQLANIKAQAKKGEINPESLKNAMDNIDKLYKLNEETMNIKVPASITASEAVRTGSKEAFDLVARNVFKDTYKVNVRQEKLQKTLVNDMKTLVKLATQGSKEVSQSVTYP